MALLELTENEIKAIIDPALKTIPGPAKVFTESLESIPANKLQPDYIKTHFSQVVGLVASAAFAKFKAYQRQASVPMVRGFIKKYESYVPTDPNSTKQFIQNTLEVFIPLATSFELRTSQMRKSRAGSTFEIIIEYLLQKIGIPCERTASRTLREKLNRMDIVLPNTEVALATPDKAIFVSCKHTLRERWKQAIPEQNRGWRMYLITLDDDIPDVKAKEINTHGLIVYVKDEVKEKSYLAKKNWIRGLSDLPKDLRL